MAELEAANAAMLVGPSAAGPAETLAATLPATLARIVSMMRWTARVKSLRG